MATSFCDLARSRHEHDLALLESLSGSWRSRRGLSDRARAVRAAGVASDREREPVFVNPVLTIDPSISTLSSTSFCCAVYAPLQATARCFVRACMRNLFSCDDT